MKADLKALRESTRKPPKKVYRAKIPESITLPPRAYDELRKLVQWVGEMPDYIVLTEGTWDLIHYKQEKAIGKHLPKSLYVVDVQIETEKTRTNSPYTRVGDLVALVEDDEMIDAGSTEIHVPIYRKTRGRK